MTEQVRDDLNGNARGRQQRCRGVPPELAGSPVAAAGSLAERVRRPSEVRRVERRPEGGCEDEVEVRPFGAGNEPLPGRVGALTAEGRQEEAGQGRACGATAVADAAGSVVGYSQGEARTSDESVAAVLPVGTRFVEITSLYVADDRRGRGLGSRLLQAVIDAAAHDEVNRSLPFTGSNDVLAVARFYRRHVYAGWGI